MSRQYCVSKFFCPFPSISLIQISLTVTQQERVWFVRLHFFTSSPPTTTAKRIPWRRNESLLLPYRKLILFGNFQCRRPSLPSLLLRLNLLPRYSSLEVWAMRPSNVSNTILQVVDGMMIVRFRTSGCHLTLRSFFRFVFRSSQGPLSASHPSGYGGSLHISCPDHSFNLQYHCRGRQSPVSGQLLVFDCRRMGGPRCIVQRHDPFEFLYYHSQST